MIQIISQNIAKTLLPYSYAVWLRLMNNYHHLHLCFVFFLHRLKILLCCFLFCLLIPIIPDRVSNFLLKFDHKVPQDCWVLDVLSLISLSLFLGLFIWTVPFCLFCTLNNTFPDDPLAPLPPVTISFWFVISFIWSASCPLLQRHNCILKWSDDTRLN